MRTTNRIKELRLKLQMTQADLAKATGLSYSSIVAYENNVREPNSKALAILESYFRVTGEYLLGWTDNNLLETHIPFIDIAYKYAQLDSHGQLVISTLLDLEISSKSLNFNYNPSNLIRLRLSDQPASAGKGVYLGPEAFTDIQVQNRPETCDADFVIRVLGDSMEPKYRDGDYLLIKTGEVSIGDIALVTLDGEGYIKRIGDGVLTSLNNHYKPIPLNDSVRVNGRVIGVLKPEWIVG